jgi:hypothetical protein
LSRQRQREHSEEDQTKKRDRPRIKQHSTMLFACGALCTVATPVCVVLA